MSDIISFPDKRYSIIYADPPWSYRQCGTTDKSRGTAAKHYPTMTTEDICALPIQSICEPAAACFMWATFPNIAEAIQVMEAWGFEYKTAAFVWVKKYAKSGKNFWGMGAYTRANAEVCLLGISSGFKAGEKIISHKVHQIIEAPTKDTAQNRMKRAAELWNCWVTCLALSCLPASGRMVGMPGEMKSHRDISANLRSDQ